MSSYQLDTPERGFSYHNDAPLDMRMSQQGTSAKDLVNTLPWQNLQKLSVVMVEDKYAKSIAKGIVKLGKKRRLKLRYNWKEIASVPASVRREQGHPARKTFQALRIEVNGELEQLSKALDAAFELLKPGKTSNHYIPLVGRQNGKTTYECLVSRLYLLNLISYLCAEIHQR